MPLLADYEAGSHVTITDGPYEGQKGLVQLRYAPLVGDEGIWYQVRLDSGETVVLPAEELDGQP